MQLGYPGVKQGLSIYSFPYQQRESIMKLSVTVSKFIVLALVLGVFTSCVSKKKYEEAVNRAAAEKSALESALAEAQEENEKLKGEFATLEGNLKMSKDEIAELSEKVKKENAKLMALQSAISEVFETYDPNDITVEERDGKLYITMSNSILFDAGRASLTKDSKGVIGKLAEVFKKNPDLKVQVEGHTDNEPVVIHKATYKDNWELSTARSLMVVREMEKGGVAATRMAAAGKGETEPIASNDSEEGRSKNRRTEFVVVPEIGGLYKMYKNDFANMGGSN
jgi:chemotaxis protein MotB